MLTIFEGPDGSGKTALAEALYKRLRVMNPRRTVHTIAHGPYLDELQIAHHYLPELLVAHATETPVIADRSWMSEAIYGSLVRDSNRLTIGQRRVLERTALGAGALMVLCLPSLQSVLASYKRRRDAEYVQRESLIRAIYTQYHAFHLRSVTIDYFNFDYDTMGTSEFIDSILERHDRHQKNIGPGTGEFKVGNTLIIGEQVNPRMALADLPFCSWDSQSCAPWLAEQLESWGVPERGLYWINARDSAGDYTNDDEWLEVLSPRKVITLGTVALEWLTQRHHKIENAAVYAIQHPQYHKRFHSKEVYSLREAFRI